MAKLRMFFTHLTHPGSAELMERWLKAGARDKICEALFSMALVRQ